VVTQMNILFCDDLRVRSLVGWSVHAFEVISRLSHMGHKVILLNRGYSQNDAGTEANPQIPLWRQVEIRMLRWPVFQPFRGELSMLGLFRHEIYVFFSTLIAIARRKGKIAVIYRRHGLFNSESLLAKLFKIPSIKEVNGIVADELRVTRWGDRVSLWVIDRIERFNMPRADRIIVVTSKLKEVLQGDYGVPEDKIVVILNGANTDLFKPMDVLEAREELGLNRSDSYICFVGSLVQWQGVQYLIRAAPLILESYPDTRFLIVGDGPWKQELTELAEQVGVMPNVIFTGMVPYQKIPLYTNASDICVLPKKPLKSGYSPLKLCEYMACGKPVVATRTDGFEILEQFKAGVLIDPENRLEFANVTTKLLQKPELRSEMGRNGREYVVENQSWESVAKRVADVCEAAIMDYRRK